LSILKDISFHRGVTNETRGTAYVVYEDIFDAKMACDHLSGFNVCNRYLIVLYYQPTKVILPFVFFFFYCYFVIIIVSVKFLDFSRDK